MPIMAQAIKERYRDKPLYALAVLPFEHEEKTDARTIHNTATCLKALYSVADAVFLIDNQRYIGKNSSMASNMNTINRLIAEPFYDLLCAGEEKKRKHIGVRLLDAGDIGQTLVGWTVLGYGKSQLPAIRLPFESKRNFRKASTKFHKGMQAMDQAISNLSLGCDPKDSGRALYLLSAPASEINTGLVQELGDYLSDMVPQAIIRYGDYPRGGSALKITVILSQLSAVDKVKGYYDQIEGLTRERKREERESVAKLKELLNAATAVPSLLGGNGK
jgi:cell division GTPase FtsZ